MLTRTLLAAMAGTLLSARAAALELSIAESLLDAAQAYAEAQHAPGGAIAVVDAGGHLVALRRLDGSFPAAAAIAIGKARTSALFRRPSRLLEDAVNQGRVAMTTLAAVTDFTPLQGGVPVARDGEIIGAIGVSGAASAAQDEEIATAASAALGGTAGQR